MMTMTDTNVCRAVSALAGPTLLTADEIAAVAGAAGGTRSIEITNEAGAMINVAAWTAVAMPVAANAPAYAVAGAVGAAGWAAGQAIVGVCRWIDGLATTHKSN